jgi:hypothetical protein
MRCPAPRDDRSAATKRQSAIRRFPADVSVMAARRPTRIEVIASFSEGGTSRRKRQSACTSLTIVDRAYSSVEHEPLVADPFPPSGSRRTRPPVAQGHPNVIVTAVNGDPVCKRSTNPP